MQRSLCLLMVIPWLMAAAPASQPTSRPAALELKMTYQNPAGRLMGKPPELAYGEGFIIVTPRWTSPFTEKDEICYRAWISGPADWASANSPKEADGYRQYAYLGQLRDGARTGVYIKLDLGYRPAGRSAHPEAKRVALPEAVPLPPGTHPFTVHVERIGPGAEREMAVAAFEVTVKGDLAAGAVDGINDAQVFQRRDAKRGDISFRVIGAPGWKAKVTQGEETVAESSGEGPEGTIDVPVGGPYEVHIEANGRRRTYKDIYVGDLWIISGQSNAVGCGYEKEFYRGPMPGVQGLTPKQGILQWTAARDGFFENTMGPWVTAAQDFYTQTGVPVGLLGHAVGSKTMDYFYDAGQNDPYFLRPLIERHGRGAAAFFWYQGESDSFRPENRDSYGPKLAGLVRSVRTLAGSEKMLVGIVQLGRYTWQKDDTFAAVREAQRQYVLGDPRAVIYSTLPYEVNKTDKIHLTSASQAALGKQIAAQMIDRERNGLIRSPGPALGEIRFSEGGRKRIVVRFTNAKGLKGNPSAEEWYVTDATRDGFKRGGFVPIESIVIDAEKQQVTIELKEAAGEGAAVSYGYRADLGGSLVNDEAAPAPCFVKVPVK